MSETTFERKEIKYRISKSQMDTLLPTLLLFMDYDVYSENQKWYLIRNVYYDTKDSFLIHLSTMSPYYKEKVRVRKYGTYHDGSHAYYLEMKKKANGVVFKRRISLSEEELQQFLKKKQVLPNKDFFTQQVMKEFLYLFSYRDLYPTLFLSYERLALKGKEDDSLRLTFDRNIIVRRDTFDFDTQEGERLIDEDQYIMEIKFLRSMPLWLSHLLSQNHIYKTSFSKYGYEYKKYILEKRSCHI